MPSPYLTKSAFKIGRSCPTKLYYYRSGYPSTFTENSYLQFLADGGHIVGKLAQLLYPDGILIDSGKGLDLAVEVTERNLKKQNVVLFEAAFRAGNKLVLVDILEKIGNTIKLIEVKSKSYDSDVARNHKDAGERTYFINENGQIDSKWREYIEDICFQEFVARSAHPEFDYIPYLCLPDKAKTTNIEGLAASFTIIEEEIEGSAKTRKWVEFSGDIEKVRSDHFLTILNVEEEIGLVRAEVEASAKQLESTLNPLRKVITPLSRKCHGCEYNSGAEGKNGFLECWGELGKVSPHIFDLYHGTTIQKGELLDSLINSKRTSLYDVQLDDLSGIRGERQSVQIRFTKENKEWISSELRQIIESVEYPLYFVDFETSRVAVPYHAGMRPYEQVAFQWSCHKIVKPGETPEHYEWINTDNIFPNFEFAKSLKATLEDKGTVLTWAHHEATTLRDIAEQMLKYNKVDSEIKEWIEDLTSKESSRILDLNQTTLDCHFHPLMEGKTSLKYVLPAIWDSHKELHQLDWLKKYVAYNADFQTINPYEVLPKIEIAEEAERVEEGTGAMLAYQDMMFGLRKNDSETKEKWKRLLLQYCELDTNAMVIVWVYWDRAVGVNNWGF